MIDDELLNFYMKQLCESYKVIHNQYFMFHDKPKISHLTNTMIKFTKGVIKTQHHIIADHIEARRKEYEDIRKKNLEEKI